MSDMKHEEIMICACSDCEHQIVLQYDSSFYGDKEEREVFASIHMMNGGFFHRLKMAFKYLFGFKCIYGHFDEFIFKKEHASKLQEIVNFLNNDSD